MAGNLLTQGKIRFVLTTAPRADSYAAHHHLRHGDGVRDIALWVDDAAYAFREAVRRGARAVREPVVQEDDCGRIMTASIATYGETIHTFVGRKHYHGMFMPGCEACGNPHWTLRDVCLRYVDHCVGTVLEGDMNTYVDF